MLGTAALLLLTVHCRPGLAQLICEDWRHDWTLQDTTSNPPALCLNISGHLPSIWSTMVWGCQHCDIACHCVSVC